MRPPRARGIVGAFLAVAITVATATFPSALGDGKRPLAPAERVPLACAISRDCFDGTREAWVDRFAARIARRIPGLAYGDRARLAETIVDEARAAAIDPLLVLALIEVESSFDPAALSERGARGLMQLRPSTMRGEAARSGIEADDPHDPVANVQAGVRYLRRLLDAFGREELALMAYNAGPNRIVGYLREGGIPERFHEYPRRIRAEVRRLRRAVGVERATVVADASASSAPRGAQ